MTRIELEIDLRVEGGFEEVAMREVMAVLRERFRGSRTVGLVGVRMRVAGRAEKLPEHKDDVA